jgi:hypothetical protein
MSQLSRIPLKSTTEIMCYQLFYARLIWNRVYSVLPHSSLDGWERNQRLGATNSEFAGLSE